MLELNSVVETSIAMLATELDIMRRSLTLSDSATKVSVYRDVVAIRCILALLSNINSRFSDSAVNLLVSSSIFNPVSFRTDKTALSKFGNNELSALLWERSSSNLQESHIPLHLS